MTEVTINAGICGQTTVIKASSEDNQHVKLRFTSTCPHIKKAEFTEIDAFQELFQNLPDTETYQSLSPHIPHVSCPVYSGFLKAIEAAAGLALPRDVTVKIEK